MRWIIAALALAGSLAFSAFADVPEVTAAATPPRCNGEAELCRRRFDDVVLAGTHNSMLNAAAGFAGPEQGHSIREQLDAGIRALLLDVYQGTPNGAAVCTDPTPLKVAQLTRQLGKETVDQLIAIRNATCPPADGPTSALYLCHSLCEEGATPLADQLDEIRGFLEEHPTEVVALVLEDYAEAADIERAFDEAKLSRYAYAHRPGTRWPTMKKLIASDKRLVVLSERQGGSPRWLLPAFDEMQDTPFTFYAVEEFSCAANRGPTDARLLMVNHWLSTPDSAATAATVNGRDQLMARVAACERERGMTPNIVAVNHAEVGDLVAVVEELNRRAGSVPERKAGSVPERTTG